MVDYENLNYDVDGDGVLDSYAEEMDQNGDGVVDCVMIDIGGDGTMDMMATDSDGDSLIDRVLMDTDGDGQVDTQVWDTNADGTPDEIWVEQDTDGDGVLDTLTHMVDTDGDGIIDQVVTGVDTDGDGTADAFVQETLTDTDGDGSLDTYEVRVDEDGDQVFERSETYSYNQQTGEILPMDQAEGEIGGVVDLENFDPEEADPEKVSGDPASSMEQWEYQGNTNRCALYSQKFIIEEITGEEVDIEEMADIAEENNWFSEENGTPLLHMNKMLDEYGIDNEMTFNNDENDLKEALENGGKVIVSIDADEVWYGETDDMFTPVDGPNHAVQVIGIDYSDPDNPMVILNDSGNPDGCGEMVPLDVFMDAWEDGDCQMIVCY